MSISKEKENCTEECQLINVKGVTKQLGIDKILEHFGLPLETSMAFGDAGNDIPMIKHAAVGVAMGNSSDQVKEIADYMKKNQKILGIFFKS